MDEPPTLSAEVRASRPPIAQADIAFLESQVVLLREKVATLQATVSKLQGQMADFQARARQNSADSSRPPSSDLPGPRPHLQHTPSGRTWVGQKGHPGRARLQRRADRFMAQVEDRPVKCPGCTFPLGATLPLVGEPICVQVWEIPPVVPEVVEHRGDRVRCPHGAASVPPMVPPESAFGPRLTAMASPRHGRFRLRMREATEVFADRFGVPLGSGSISALCREVATALDEPHEDVRAQVEAEMHANVDETGWKQAGERRWLWVAVTPLCTLFVVAKNRSGAALLNVLREASDGVVSSDRFKAYLSIPLGRRQICWAHLKRPVSRRSSDPTPSTTSGGRGPTGLPAATCLTPDGMSRDPRKGLTRFQRWA